MSFQMYCHYTKNVLPTRVRHLRAKLSPQPDDSLRPEATATEQERTTDYMVTDALDTEKTCVNMIPLAFNGKPSTEEKGQGVYHH